MMGDLSLPDPPDVSSLNPELMTTSELHSSLERIFAWLHEVDALPESAFQEQVTESKVQDVREAANLLLVEQRERHSDERAPRGG